MMDADGRGTVVFDIETTELIEDDVPIERMEMSVACARWIPQGTKTAKEAEEEAEELTVWNQAVARTPTGAVPQGIESLLKWFDNAQQIVGYNACNFDLHVLKQYYKGDNDRWNRHQQKLRDPMAIIQQATGRRYKMSTILRVNTHTPKAGHGSDAPGWWQEGRLTQLETYCIRDVEALMGLVMQPEIRLPGRQATREISILSSNKKTEVDRKTREGTDLLSVERERSSIKRQKRKDITHTGQDDKDTAEEGENEHNQNREMQDAVQGAQDQQEIKEKEKEIAQESEDESDVDNSEEIMEIGDTRKEANQCEDGENKESTENRWEMRKRRQTTYDQVRRRTHTREEYKAIYLDRRDGRGTNKKRAVIMGITAMEHTVAGTYEWRDEALRATHGERKRYWEAINSRENDERQDQRQRARREQ